MVERLYRTFPQDMKLIGTLTNAKTIMIGQSIEFWDAMDMVSPMSLAKFCKSMQEQGKFDGSSMFKITCMRDWHRMKSEAPEEAQRLLDYCVQDVTCMSRAMTKFNDMVYGILGIILGDVLQKQESVPWILEKTIAKLSYRLFTRYIIPKPCAPEGITSSELYRAVTECYRGGFVLSFIFGKIDIKSNGLVNWMNYIDINSLYPSIMSNSYIPLKHQSTPIESRYSNLPMDPRSIYEVLWFDIGEEDHFGFFGVNVYSEKGQKLKVIYPTRWKANNFQRCLWVFGTELILFSKIFPRGKYEIGKYFRCAKKKRLFRPI